MPADVSLLADVPFLTLLNEPERAALAELMDTIRVRQGEIIFHGGDSGDALYITRSGRVQVYVENTQGERIILGENRRGDVFGEISLLDGGPRTATAVAAEDSELVKLDRQHLLELVHRYPHTALDMLSVMGSRLRATNELVRLHVSRNVNVEEEERLTLGDRVADRVAQFGGSWTFIIAFSVVLLLWMVLNTWVFYARPFDPYPFILLNLVLSTLAALQAPIIMMSQNRLSAKDRLKADLDYQVNLKAELEVAQLHHKMDRLYESLQAHLAKAGRPADPPRAASPRP